jgi:hypothetical protein
MTVVALMVVVVLVLVLMLVTAMPHPLLPQQQHQFRRTPTRLAVLLDCFSLTLLRGAAGSKGSPSRATTLTTAT